MDHTSIPSCALYRNTGTIIVRLKMEVSTSCCKREVCPASSCPAIVHRPSGCELCNRTRLISHYSDCDSDNVKKYRPNRSSAARSRYVNVCAAVCLLLLVGSLSPRSSAAPHRSRSTMERQRRAAEEENGLWANPCDYSDNSKPVYPPNHVREAALKLVAQAKSAFSSAYMYNETIAKLHSFEKFSEELLRNWETYDWLRKTHEDALPKEKVLNKTMPDEYIEQLMINIDQKLPSMYMALKMIVAGLYNFSKEGLNDNVANDDTLKENITRTMHDVRAVLCYFNDIMNARNLKIPPLLNKDIPDFANDSSFGLLLYRDTLNYLEYLIQVFTKLAEKESKLEYNSHYKD